MNSIKTALVVLFFLGVCLPLFSQVNLGIKVGGNYNYNGFSSDSLNLSLDNGVSVSGGGFIRIKIKKIHLQGEALIVGHKGSYINGTTPGNVDFMSFDVPLLVGYKIMDLKVVKVRLNAGIIPSFYVGNLGDLENSNFEDAFYSATGGISLDIPLFLFDLRYQGAIGDYYQLQNVNSNTTLTNNLLTFSVAWKII